VDRFINRTVGAALVVFWLATGTLAAGVWLRSCDDGHMRPVHAAQGVDVYRHDGDAVLPNAKLTPGEADPALTAKALCAAAFRTRDERHVTPAEKRQVCAAYGQTEGCPGPGYEIDHLISIELGGANTVANLWPQPVDAPDVIGFRTKDVVENRLHRLVCAGGISLADAQACISRDWYGCASKLKILPEPRSYPAN
jgi:hypothetical protein